MSNPSPPHDTPVAATQQEDDTLPTRAPRPPSGGPGSGHGIVSLCLAAASFVSAPFLLLIPVAGFIPAVLAAAGFVFAWIGCRGSNRRPGLAVAGLVVSVVLFGLTLNIAMLWTRLVAAPAIRDYPELRAVLGHIKQRLIENLVVFPGIGAQALLGLLAGVLLVAGGLLLRRRHS